MKIRTDTLRRFIVIFFFIFFSGSKIYADVSDYFCGLKVIDVHKQPSPLNAGAASDAKGDSAIGQVITNVLGMKFIYVPPGTFTMGSPDNEPGRNLDEQMHIATLTQGFYLQTTEVTQGQWRRVMGDNPSFFKDCGDDCPVETISWNDTQEFIAKLNEKFIGVKYRLPYEAEWEYAARAGTKSPFAIGSCLSVDLANYDGNEPFLDCPQGRYRETTVRVGSFRPNAWGLYDMHGNVCEWCQDWYGDYPDTKNSIDPKGPQKGLYRVLRGGAWIKSAAGCRAAFRYWEYPEHRYRFHGVRLVMDLNQ